MRLLEVRVERERVKGMEWRSLGYTIEKHVVCVVVLRVCCDIWFPYTSEKHVVWFVWLPSGRPVQGMVWGGQP